MFMDMLSHWGAAEKTLVQYSSCPKLVEPHDILCSAQTSQARRKGVYTYEAVVLQMSRRWGLSRRCRTSR
ncbi:hypothetical protein J4Q44_G00328210 [Coregonus suidteri]|uniref:Uncharacterized protein n=1 Tax=Coregonus suidteri TaxID=861788 RepID=A0AAN8KKY6_9TELE